MAKTSKEANAERAMKKKKPAAAKPTAATTAERRRTAQAAKESLVASLFADEPGTSFVVTCRFGKRRTRDFVCSAKTAAAAKRRARAFYKPEVVDEIVAVRTL